ncbi:hydrogenase maturation protease [Candidatus Sumerlaeota bacterium]|nr:hydrogenase maturation protease [Candidatus Sumerlaeota bacterium]
MSSRPKRLLLGLGNDILTDDAVGLVAVRALRERFGDTVDMVEAGESGLSILDHIEGYDQVLILDAMQCGQVEVGTVMEVCMDDMGMPSAPSPHFTGMPEMWELGKRLKLKLPEELRILAMEVAKPFVFGESLSEETAPAMPAFIEAAANILQEWEERCHA